MPDKMLQVPKYRLAKRFWLFGKELVVYDCPFCGSSLESDLSEAGSDDDCPYCASPFQVPGVDIVQERERKRQEGLRAKEVRERERLQKLREQELAAAHAREERLANLLRQALTEDYRYVIVENRTYVYDEHKEVWREATRSEEARLDRRLAERCHYIRIDGIYYLYLEAKGWRKATPYEKEVIRHAEDQGGRPWFDGLIISQNYGSVIVTPYMKRDGTKVYGHTKNAPGEGPARLREHGMDITSEAKKQYKSGV